MTALFIIGGFILFAGGFILGVYYGAGMGIRIFAPDVMAIVEGKTDDLQYKELQEFIERNVARAKAKSVKQEWEEEKKRLHEQGIY